MLLHSPNACDKLVLWARLLLAVGNLTQVSHAGGKNPVTGAAQLPRGSCVGKKLEAGARGGNQLSQDTGVCTASPSTPSTSHSRVLVPLSPSRASEVHEAEVSLRRGSHSRLHLGKPALFSSKSGCVEGKP